MLQELLDALAAPAEPLDVVMLDGFVCAVLLREQPVPAAQWLPYVLDIEGRDVSPPRQAQAARQAVLRRHDGLRDAISRRQWFDPWVFELDEDAAPGEAVMPWAAGFALAAERYALPLPPGEEAAIEALALIYQYLDADHWPAVTVALADAIGELEPPRRLDEAVEDLVRAVLLLADHTGPTTPTRRSARR